MPQRLSNKFPQTKTSGARHSKPAAKRQKVQDDIVPRIMTLSKTSSLPSTQDCEDEDADCLRQFDLTSRFGEPYVTILIHHEVRRLAYDNYSLSRAAAKALLHELIWTGMPAMSLILAPL